MDKSKYDYGWIPVDCNIDIGGVMHNLKFPSRIQMMAALRHLGHDGSIVYLQQALDYKEIDYVVDVGGNAGAIAILLGQAFNADVLSLEPVAMNYECLVHNASTFPNITPLKMGAYHKKARLRIAMPNTRQRPDLGYKYGNSGLFSIYGQDVSQSEAIDVDTLDSMVTRKVDYLKMDVEGAELHVLRGATRILTEDRPIVQMEAREGNMKMSNTDLEDYFEFFGKYQYMPVGDYFGDVILMPAEVSMEVWTYDADRDCQ